MDLIGRDGKLLGLIVCNVGLIWVFFFFFLFFCIDDEVACRRPLFSCEDGVIKCYDRLYVVIGKKPVTGNASGMGVYISQLPLRVASPQMLSYVVE